MKGAGIRARTIAGGRAVAAAAVLACAAALTGCGSGVDGGDDQDAPIVHAVATTADAGPFGDMTPRQELRAAEDAMGAVSAMTVDEVQERDGHHMHLSATITDGSGCTLSEQLDSDSIRVVGTGGNTFLQADPAYWRAHGGVDGPRVADALKGKWLRLDARPSATGIGRYCSISGFMAGTSSNVDLGTVVRSRPTTLGGKPVVTVVHVTSSQKATVRIAATGTPYILRSDIVGSGSQAGMTGVATFSGFGRATHISPPPAALTVSYASLGTSHLSV